MELSRRKQKNNILELTSADTSSFFLASAPKNHDLPIVQLVIYFLFSAAFIGVLVCIKLFAPTWPTWVIALAWALLTSFVAIGIAYSWVIRKTHRQVKYKPGGKMERLNRGRVGCIIISFLLGTALAMSLIAEVPKWGERDWVLAVLAVPIFCVVALCVRRRVRKEFKTPFQTAGIVSWASVLTTIVLCLLFVLLSLASPEPSASSALQSFLDVERPYANSPSFLMREIGELSALSEGLTKYAIAETALLENLIAVGWNLILAGSGFFAIAKILSICSMNPVEMKRVLQPLEDLTVSENQSQKPVHIGYVVTAALSIVVLFGGFCVLEHTADEVSKDAMVQKVKGFIQVQIGNSVCVIDGKYYDHQKVLNMIEEESENANALSDRAQKDLSPLVEKAFELRIDQVDNYVDWFYRLDEGIREGFADLFTEGESEVFEKKLDETIEGSSDDSLLYETIAYYSEEANKIHPKLLEEIQTAELDTTESWLLEKPAQMAEWELNAPTRIVERLINPSNTLGHKDAGDCRISIDYPQWVISMSKKDYKNRIEEAIEQEHYNYKVLAGDEKTLSQMIEEYGDNARQSGYGTQASN